MRGPWKTQAASATIFALVLSMAAPAFSAAPGGRLEGLVIGIDGRPATDHRVHLIGAGGEALGSAAVNGEGIYSFAGLAAGRYSLGVELPDGQVAPVAAPAVRLGEDELARRDLKLMGSDPDLTNGALQANYGLGSWWNNLSTAGKSWTVIAIVVAAALTYDALSGESDGSPSGN